MPRDEYGSVIRARRRCGLIRVVVVVVAVNVQSHCPATFC